MAKLTRVTGKIFAGNTNLTNLGIFGSAKAGNPTNPTSSNVEAQIQSLSAYGEGWTDAIVTNRNFPPIEEVNGVLRTISYQNCYLLQEGIPEYDINTEYSNTSIVKNITGQSLSFYISLKENNIGNPLSDGSSWMKANLNSARNIGEIITSAIPLNDSGVHLLDGALLDGTGSYKTFFDYIASIYNSSLNYFCTETEWQSTVSTYGACGKFVYNSTNKTVRLPKIKGVIEGTTDITGLGNLVQAGLPNITGTVDSIRSGNGWGRTYTGCFYDTGIRGERDQANGGSQDGGIGFDASRSSQIYGRSTTVQPQTIKVLYYIVLSNSDKTDIEIDINNITTDLNGKADTDLSNISPTQGIKNEIITWGLPDYANAITISSPFTAPAYGVITWQNNGTANCTVNSITVYVQGNDDNNEGCIFLPISSGDIVTFTKDESSIARFLPFKGVN